MVWGCCQRAYGDHLLHALVLQPFVADELDAVPYFVVHRDELDGYEPLVGEDHRAFGDTAFGVLAHCRCQLVERVAVVTASSVELSEVGDLCHPLVA